MAQRETPALKGTLVASFELITDSEAGHIVPAVDSDTSKSTLTSKSFDECLTHNLVGVEAEIERLRASGDTSHGPIRLTITRQYPEDLGRSWDADEDWPANGARPSCPPDTRLVTLSDAEPGAWCQREAGEKHGEQYYYDKQGRVTLIQEWRDGKSAGVQLRRPSEGNTR